MKTNSSGKKIAITGYFALAILAFVSTPLLAGERPMGIRPQSISSTSHGVVSQIADGTSWITSITLVNLEDSPSEYQVDFYDDSGNPMKLDFTAGSWSSVSGTLAVNGSIVIETTGESSVLKQGYAIVNDTICCPHLGGHAVFRNHIPGRPDTEAVVPLSSFDSDGQYVLPFDNTNGFVTSMAYCNPWKYDATTITAAIYDEAGNRLYLDQFRADPRKHEAFTLPERWTQTVGKRGVVVFSVTGYWSALGLRFNPAGSFTSVFPFTKY